MVPTIVYRWMYFYYHENSDLTNLWFSSSLSFFKVIICKENGICTFFPCYYYVMGGARLLVENSKPCIDVKRKGKRWTGDADRVDVPRQAEPPALSLCFPVKTDNWATWLINADGSRQDKPLLSEEGEIFSPPLFHWKWALTRIGNLIPDFLFLFLDNDINNP